MRVLVVEDQQDMADLLVDFLLELGHQPLLVRSAESAVVKLATERPDSIILDLQLPGMTGLDFLELRPVRDSHTPVIAVSGVASEDEARECLRLGALDFMEKPVPLERLAEVLAYLELGLLGPRHDGGPAESPERRTAPRVRLVTGVRLSAYDGRAWSGTAVDLTPHGMKVRGIDRLPAGGAIRLKFSPPDGGEPLEILALPLRHDPDGIAFSFANVTDAEVDRLRALIGRLLAA